MSNLSHNSSSANSSSNPRHFIIVGVLIVITTLVLKALLDWALPLPLQASVQAVTIDWLFGLHIWLIAFLFALVSVFMVYAIVVFRRREGDDGDGEHFEGNTALEIGWTTAPLIFVVIFSWLGLTTMWEVTAQQENELVVVAEAFQWNWNFYYDETANPEMVAIDGVLVLPVDQPVLVRLRSKDVLHAFWVPEFRVKQDVVPYILYDTMSESADEGAEEETEAGEHSEADEHAEEGEHAADHPEEKMTEVRFTPSLVGDYKLRCAELCGLSHYKMVKDVKVVEQAEYDEWYELNFGQAATALADQ